MKKKKQKEHFKDICRFGNKCKYGMLFLIVLSLILIAFIIIPQISMYAIDDDKNFNLNLEILDRYLEIPPGESIWFTAELTNPSCEGREDVIMSYKIVDKKNNEITSKTETIAVETKNSFVREIEIPKNTPSRTYTLEVEATYADGTIGFASQNFSVTEGEKKFNYTLLIYIIIIAIILIVMMRLIFIVSKLKKAIEKITQNKNKR